MGIRYLRMMVHYQCFKVETAPRENVVSVLSRTEPNWTWTVTLFWQFEHSCGLISAGLASRNIPVDDNRSESTREQRSLSRER
jgi:hypothetical protein